MILQRFRKVSRSWSHKARVVPGKATQSSSGSVTSLRLQTKRLTIVHDHPACVRPDACIREVSNQEKLSIYRYGPPVVSNLQRWAVYLTIAVRTPLLHCYTYAGTETYTTNDNLAVTGKERKLNVCNSSMTANGRRNIQTHIACHHLRV
jgi:hypothetical protein